MKRIPTWAHGILDYATVATCLALPRARGWSPDTTRLFAIGGLFGLGYSVLTRYELGLLRILPMRTHLALDVVFGAWFLMVATGSPGDHPAVRRFALVLAAVGLTAPLMTNPR